jgi:hypothetical protein
LLHYHPFISPFVGCYDSGGEFSAAKVQFGSVFDLFGRTGTGTGRLVQPIGGT